MAVCGIYFGTLLLQYAPNHPVHIKQFDQTENGRQSQQHAL